MRVTNTDPEVDHVLRGWHHAKLGDENALKWLKERQTAIADVLKRNICGGKDVMTVMMQNGYLDLGPQLLPIKSKRSLTLKRLQKGIGLVILSNSKIINQYETVSAHHIGVVDKRLRVRTFTLETPRMWRRSQRYLFCYDDPIHDTWKETVTSLMMNRIRPLISTFEKRDLPNGSTKLTEMDTRSIDNGFTIGYDMKYKVFDERGKRIDSVLDVIEREKKHEMTLAVSADRMVTSTRKILGDMHTHANICWKILQAKCHPIEIEKPLFLEADYDDE